nr:YLP motif-containing protein 1-like isoform X3 [Odocoileus virginianus texanus]
MLKKEILQDLDGDDLTPPPYWIMTRLPPSAPPGPEAALMPDPGPGEVPAVAATLSPALPEFVEPPFWQTPIPAMETSGQRPQNSTSAGPPRLYPPLPDKISKLHCSQANAASQHRQKPPGIQVKDTLPFEHLEVDFIEMKPHRHYHYLLVIV